MLLAVPASAGTAHDAGPDGRPLAVQPAVSPEAAIKAAWDAAKAAGSYRLRADLEMKLDPSASGPARINPARELDWRLDGEVDLSGKARLNLRAESAAYKSQPVELIQAGGQTYVRRDGKLELTENPAGVAAPTADFMAYLAAAKDVEVIERAADGRASHLRFAIDGPRFAKHVATEMQRQMAGQVPSGVAIAPPEVLNRTTGRGELWLGEDGRPRRQSLSLDMPAVNASYGGRASIVADFSGYGEVGELPEPISDGKGGWLLGGEEHPAPSDSRGGPGKGGGLTIQPAGGSGHLGETEVSSGALGSRGADDQKDSAAKSSPTQPGTTTSALEKRLDGLVADAGRALDLATMNLARGGAPMAGLLLLVLAGAFVVRSGRRRKLAVYATVVSLVSVSIVGSPLLRAMQIDAFLAKQTLAAEKRTDLVSEVMGDAPSAETARMLQAMSAQASPVSINQCGDGSQTVDTDADGLSDFKESCLGTDPLNADTDDDTITDTLELEGFTLTTGGQRWTTDPFKVDSNGDGRGDFDEWAAPYGLATNPDIDGDGLPNVWDGDDDGDQVPDLTDLSPEAYSGYLDQLSLQTQGGGYDGYQYIQLQVQPEQQSHWRYTLSTLDWPADEQGDMQDLDDSTDDLRLVPMLEVTTDDKPRADLADRYGAIPAGKLYLPLLPENDGGKITTFRAKVAYDPTALDQIDWSSARFLWVANGRSDSYTDCANPDAPDEATCQIRAGTDIIANYVDRFRLTGLQITKTGPFEALLLGTPTNPTEDTRLFGLAFGMNSSFMQFNTLFDQTAGETALAEIEQRVTSPNTSITLTWGISTTAPVAAERHVYSHIDEGIAFTNGSVLTSFLDREYTAARYNAGGLCRDAAGDQFRCASVLGAYEFSTGVYDLSQLGSGQVNGAAISVPLASINVATQRSLKVTTYEETPVGGWQAVSAARQMELMFARYGDRIDTILADLQARFPDRSLTERDLYFGLTTVYMSWAAGVGRLIALDTVPLDVADHGAEEDERDANISAAALSATRAALSLPSLIGDLTEGIKDSYGFDKLTGDVPDADLHIQYRQRAIYGAIAINASVATLGSLALAVAYAVCAGEGDDACDEDKLQAANYAFTSMALIEGLRGGATAVQDVRLVRQAAALKAAGDTSDAARATAASAKAVSTVSKATVVMAAVGLIIDLAVVWTVFGLTLAHADGNPMVISVAIATAVVGTIFAIVLFALALFVPVGTLISAILGIIDAILSLATGGEWSITVVLVKLFFDVKLLTTVDNLDFLDFRIEMRDNDSGNVRGNTYEVKDSFVGVIKTTSDGGAGDARSSNASAAFHGIAPNPIDATAADMNLDRICTYADGKQTCTQEVGTGFRLNKAKPNVRMLINRSINFTLRYVECGLFGTVCEIRKSIHDGFDIPDLGNDSKDDDLPIEIYLDVLPPSIEGVWTMPELTVRDKDFDGLVDATEAATGTNTSPTLWDSDGDGLSDGYETGAALGGATRPTNPNDPDTDNDGLTDGQEFALGTRAEDSGDTDRDGLYDGQEVFHQDLADVDGDSNTTEWTGGWTVTGITLPSGNPAILFSDPSLMDKDGDGLTDSMERGYGTSPYAFNDAPRVILDTSPLAVGPTGQSGAFFNPGQSVSATLTVQSVGVYPITQTLFACLPSFFNGSTGGTLTGSRTVTPTTSSCANGQGYQWAFTPASPLSLGQVVSTTFDATINSALSQTTLGDATASVNYQSGVLTDTVHLVVDVDNPTVAVDAPAAGALLRGQTATIEGTAADATTWVNAVEVNPGTGYVTAAGYENWSYLWTLPGTDGAYTLNVRSKDPFGHSSTVRSVPVTVDNTPPTVTLSQQASVVTGDAVIALGGSVSDATSGVERVQLSIDRKPWRTVALNAGRTAWTFDWRPGGDGAQGEHAIGVRAYDRAGNVSTTLNTSVVVDRLAPTDDLTSKRFELDPPHVKPGQATALRGFANDAGRAPLPPRPAELKGTVDGVGDATVWLSPRSATEDDGGVKAVWLGDVNGDGRADLALGLPGAAGGKGRVAIVNGRAGDFPVPAAVEALSDSPNLLLGDTGAAIGGMLAAAGDVNADGFGDLLVGDATHNRVFLVFGRPSDFGTNVSMDGEKSGTWTVITLPAAPTHVAAAGDVNGDGFDDVLVAAGGQAYLLANARRSWPASAVAADDAAATLPLPTGGLASGVGDVDGDQRDDFVVSNPNGSGGAAAGIYLFRGRTGLSEGTRTALALAVGGSNALALVGGSSAGARLAALGDVNGDGKADFAYSATGGPRLVFGRSSGTWTPDRTFGSYSPAADGFVAAPGDVNADGYNDLLLGSAAGKAYLILGGASMAATPPVEATLDGVAGAASAPYTAGADLNCDASSDLLLVPTNASVTPLMAAALQFAATAAIDPATLPLAPAIVPSLEGRPESPAVRTEIAKQTKVSTNALRDGVDGDLFVTPSRRADLALPAVPRLEVDGMSRQDALNVATPDDVDAPDAAAALHGTTRYVDDDGGCAGQTPCYTTIQAAVDASVATDSIVVGPGVYAPFTIDGKSSLNVTGVDADAVFVDGAGAAQGALVKNATGVALRDLTVRNAVRGVKLENAGAGGYTSPVAGQGNPALRTTLDGLLVHNVTSALDMDRVSSAAVLSSTLVAKTGGGSLLDVTGAGDTALTPAWSTAPADLPVSFSLADGGGAVPFLSGVRVFEGGGSRSIQHFDSGVWSSRADLPLDLVSGSAVTADRVEDQMYVLSQQRRFKSGITGVSGNLNVNGFVGVRSMSSSGQFIYAGGEFQTAGGVTSPGIARYDTTSGTWTAVGQGLRATSVSSPSCPCTPTVNATAVDSSGNLYVGGFFDQAVQSNGTILSVNGIAKWNGSSWSALGSGVQDVDGNAQIGDIRVLTASGTDIYAGGHFDKAGGITVKSVAKWNGSAWSALGSGVTRPNPSGGTRIGFVWAINVVGSNVYIGGNFDSTPTDHITRWDGSAYQAVGPVTSPLHYVVGIAFLGSQIYVSDRDSLSGFPHSIQRLLSGGTAWQDITPTTFGTPIEGDLVASGGKVYVVPEFYTNPYVGVYDGSTWSLLTGTQTADDQVWDLLFNGNDIWVGGDFNSVNDEGGGSVAADGFAKLSPTPRLLNYPNTTFTWQARAVPPLFPATGSSMAADGAGSVYATFGGGTAFYRYNILADTWTAMASVPVATTTGAAAVWAGGSLYLFPGDASTDSSASLYRFTPNGGGGTWAAMAPTTFDLGGGADLEWDGVDGLYATQGGNGRAFARYSIAANTWTVLGTGGSGQSTPGGINPGGALVRRDLTLYSARGGTAFDTFSPIGIYPQKLTLDHVALVAPESAASTRWLASAVPAIDFVVGGASNQWLPGPATAWLPSGTGSPLTVATTSYAAAGFANPAADVYRIPAGSALTSGYHRPAFSEVHVYPTQAECTRCTLPLVNPNALVWGTNAFDSLQAAIDTRAPGVVVHAGQYPQPFYLTSGVRVVGAGAERTVVFATPPASGTTRLVSAEGIAGATLARVTLDGGRTTGGPAGTVDTFRAEQGAHDLTFARNIVRRAGGKAIALDGAATDVEVVNNTLVDNAKGLASSSCASIDVRNTIFAAHTTSAIDSQACAAQTLHTYNDFFSNAIDFAVGGAAAVQPGRGELFRDPLFTDAPADDYRPESGSPVVDAGNPSDPVPPGSGGRVDVGYVEQGAAAFYADDDYCESCINDGLEWQVDAFRHIQDALNAAGAAIQALDGTADPRQTVGVGPGTYAEHLVVPSHVRLAGVGAEQVTVNAGGTGSAVTLNNVVEVEVSGLRLVGSSVAALNATGATNNATISRNLITSNTGNGIHFAGGATGVVKFNTLVANGGAALHVEGAGSRATAEDNIAAANVAGWRVASGGVITSDFNLLNGNTTNLSGVAAGADDKVGVSPSFANTTDYGLNVTSTAVDAARQTEPVPAGGGDRADLGYREVLAPPMLLLFGKEGASACAVGNAGLGGVEVGLAPVADASLPVAATVPTTWLAATLQTPNQTASYWTAGLTPSASGMYRLYTRATDQSGNAETGAEDWFSGAVIADGTAPSVAWVSPAAGASIGDAAVALVATASDYVDAGGTSQFAVDQIRFELDGNPVAAEWAAGWNPAGGGPRTFRAFAPVTVGSHTIEAVAVDKAGNVGRSGTRSITVSGSFVVALTAGGTSLSTDPSAPAQGGESATITSPVSGTAVSDTALTVRGTARFGTSTGNAGRVTVSVDGGTAVAATLDDNGATLTGWEADVTIPVTQGNHSVEVSMLGVGQTDSILVILDTTSPSVSVDSPATGSVVRAVVPITITASDGGSGLAAVEASFDGGYIWTPAAQAGAAWRVDWTTPDSVEDVSFPVRVRATDNAGNAYVAPLTLVVDNSPPLGLTPVTFDVPEGTHLDGPTDVAVQWQPAIEPVGGATVRFAVDHITGTIPGPTSAVSGTSATAQFTGEGEWYVHLSAVDDAGGTQLLHFGPWHVGGFADTALACADRDQTITLDGLLDRPNNEWRDDKERLDDDERGVPGGRDVQELYATWEGDAILVGWQGAWWTLDGRMWAYLDLEPSVGTTSPVSGTTALPFDADHAVKVEGEGLGTLFHWTGSSWQAETPAGFAVAQGESGGTEMRVPIAGTLSGITSAKLLAYAEDDDGAWSVFPTTNPLAGPWTGFYLWTGPCTIATPNQNQPRVAGATLEMTSPQGTAGFWGPNQDLEYVLTAHNPEEAALAGLQVNLSASAGLGFGLPWGASRSFSFGSIAPGASAQLTVTAHLDGNLMNTASVTMTAQLVDAASQVLDTDALSHTTDGVGPKVDILGKSLFIKPGPTTIYGSADDGAGSGVASVSANAGFSSLPVSGTLGWSTQVDVPDNPTFAFTARATDLRGNVGATTEFSFTVDNAPPTVTLSLPPLIIGDVVELGGTTRDPHPAGGYVVAVEVQVDDDGATWEPAHNVFAPDASNVQVWQFTWDAPPDQGLPHRLRVRATDAAGNTSAPGPWQSTLVFRIPPIDAGPEQSVTEGDEVAFAGSIGAFGSSDPYQVTWSFGDGISTTMTVTPTGESLIPLPATHVYADNGTYQPTLTVMHDGVVAEDATVVEVANAQPTVDAGGDRTGSEGVPVPLTVSFHDQGTADTHAASIDWGDGSAPFGALIAESPFGPPGSTAGADGTASFTAHTYADDGIYSATSCVADDDEPAGPVCASFLITVANVAPVVTTSPVSQTVQYSDPLATVTITATDVASDTLSATTAWKPLTGTFTAGLPVTLTLTTGSCALAPYVRTCNWSLAGTAGMAPGTYTVRITVTDDAAAPTAIDLTLVVRPEDARSTYTGPLQVSTSGINVNTVVVPLRATIQDISALPADPATDPSPGDIKLATVTFVDRDNGNAVLCATTTLVTLPGGGSTTASATCDWTATFSGDGQEYRIGTIVGGYYLGNRTDEDALVTVSKPSENFITGGGYLVNESTGGPYGGAAGLKTNFGFNIKYNKQLTNLQGKVNVIVRKDGKTYQIKSTSLTSLAVVAFKTGKPNTGTGELVSKANIQDITDPLNPISIAGNATLNLVMKDNGESGGGTPTDTLGITLWSKEGSLLFSSKWTGTATLQQVLAGGNLQVK